MRCRRRSPVRAGGAVVILAGLFGALAGCSGERTSQKPPQQQHHIQEIFHFFLVYQMRNGGKVPADASELKTWAQANQQAESEIFSKMGIAGREESAFISPRDGQPYVVRQMLLDEKNPGLLDPTVAYEQQGLNGKRYVVFKTGRAEEVDAEKLQAAIEKKGAK